MTPRTSQAVADDKAVCMQAPPLEIRIIAKTMEQPLAELFQALKRARDEEYFQPHPLTDEEAKRRARYAGKDLHYALLEGDQILGYGLLRGWDEGYEVPSLGIAIRPSMRRQGLAKLLMHFLHAAAKRRGASTVTLKVYPDNAAAVALYRGQGYVFRTEEEGQLVGSVDL